MISVIIPVLNESDTIGNVVEFARCDPKVKEVIVVDDGSIDGTPEMAAAAGATVITSTLLGKGASMEDGMPDPSLAGWVALKKCATGSASARLACSQTMAPSGKP